MVVTFGGGRLAWEGADWLGLLACDPLLAHSGGQMPLPRKDLDNLDESDCRIVGLIEYRFFFIQIRHVKAPVVVCT